MKVTWGAGGHLQGLSMVGFIASAYIFWKAGKRGEIIVSDWKTQNTQTLRNRGFDDRFLRGDSNATLRNGDETV